MQTRTVPPRFPATPGRKDGVRAALFAGTLECAPAWSGAVRRAGKQVAGVASVWCCHLPALGTLCPPPSLSRVTPSPLRAPAKGGPDSGGACPGWTRRAGILPGSISEQTLDPPAGTTRRGPG